MSLRIRAWGAALALAAICLAAPSPGVLAQETPETAPREAAVSPALRFDLAGGPVFVFSDRLVLDHRENWAEFTGNVRAVQADTEVRAARMRILYHPDAAREGEGDLPAQALKRIEAWDDVVISGKDFSGRADRAIYEAATRDLLLFGAPAVLLSGENSVAGGRITLNAEGRVTVEGTGSAPVEATFYPEGHKAGPTPPPAAP
ncbi:MAG: LptA/OstA family protein [Pseudomonadota bacterium]